jgi:hypothetical protein
LDNGYPFQVVILSHTDGATSVLNRWCRAHEVENLYAVDGSPFPTGTGANPTLTIMAMPGASPTGSLPNEGRQLDGRREASRFRLAFS